MESNINHTFISDYSKSFAQKLLQSFFSSGKTFVNGEELLNFSEIQQLNYFILKGLFNKWKQEIDNLKSPYFDYEQEEVKDALKEFMNILSKHILIQKNDLGPLVEEAAKKTMLLAFSPYEFYLQEINNPEYSRMSIQDLYDLEKYIKLNKHLLDIYIKRFEDEGIEAVFNDDAVRMFNEVCESIIEIPEDVDPFLRQFSSILELDGDMIYGVGNPPDLETISEEETVSKANEPDFENTPVNEQFKKDQKMLLDTLAEEQKETIADLHLKEPSDGIKKNITLNQRFMFLKELFQGNMDEFEMVINALENCQSRQQALDFIQGNYFDKDVWAQDAEEVQEFLGIIQRRFPE